MKRLLILSPTVDTAGLGIAMKRAFDACAPDWQARAVRCADSWLRYPADIEWDRNNGEQTREVERLWAEADVVHIMEQPRAAYWFAGATSKPIVVQHLGTYYRRQISQVSADCRGLRSLECADMHDLIRRAPYPLRWLPDIVDPAPLEALRLREYHPSGLVRIAHAPTDREIKSTALIVAAIERLKGRGLPIEFDLIEGTANGECLARKARADIFVDHLGSPREDGYGLNAIESWCMGQPVVDGIDDQVTETLLRDDAGGTLPYVKATPETLEAVIASLVGSAALREGWAQAGRNHVERFHTPAAVVARAIALYEEIMS